MYSVDGIALHNPGMGWKFRGPSRPLSDLTVQRTSLRVPGMPGVVANVDSVLASLDAPAPTLVIRTPKREYETLLALLGESTLLSRADLPGREAPYELLSTSHEGFGNADAIIDVSATIRLPGVFWRDVDTTTHLQAIDAASKAVDAWWMNGLVTDAVIRVKGPIGGLYVRSGPAWLRYTPAVPAGSFLRYECGSGRAWVTTTDTWSDGAEVSGTVSADGPGGKFAVFPARVSPTDRVARLQVDTTSRAAGAVIEVRGKGAYVA